MRGPISPQGLDVTTQAVGKPASTTVEQKDYKEELSQNLSSAIQEYKSSLSHRSQYRKNDIAQVVEDSITTTLSGLDESQKDQFIVELNTELGIQVTEGQTNSEALKAYFSNKRLVQLENFLNENATQSVSSDEPAKVEGAPETSEPEALAAETSDQEVATETPEATKTEEPPATEISAEPEPSATATKTVETQTDLTALQEENQRLQEELRKLEGNQSSQQAEIKALKDQLVQLTKAQKRAEATQKTATAKQSSQATQKTAEAPKSPGFKNIFRGQPSIRALREAQLSDKITTKLKGRNLKTTAEARTQAAYTAFTEIMALHQQDAVKSAEQNIGQQGFLSKKLQAMKGRLDKMSTTKQLLLLGAGTGAATLVAGPFAAAGVLTYAAVSKVAGTVNKYIPNRDYLAQQGVLAQQMTTKSLDSTTHSQAKAEYLRQSEANKAELFAQFQKRVMRSRKFRNANSSESELREVLLKESLWFQRELKASQENANATMRRKTFKNLAIAGAVTTIGFPMALAAAPGLAAGTLTLGAAALNATGVAATTLATGAVATGATVGAVASSGVVGAAAVGATAVGAGYAASKVMDSGSAQYT